MPRISQCCKSSARPADWPIGSSSVCGKCGLLCITYDEASFKAGQESGRKEMNGRMLIKDEAKIILTRLYGQCRQCGGDGLPCCSCNLYDSAVAKLKLIQEED